MKKPKIVHISCHGDYDKKSQQFYLQFEKQGGGENGIADNFNQSQLKELLGGAQNHGIELAFVSACHSEEMGKVLLDCGISAVIAVNAESAIADDICLIFSRNLYMNLLFGQTIESAFDNAKRACKTSGTDCNSCCCGHKHTASCKW